MDESLAGPSNRQGKTISPTVGVNGPGPGTSPHRLEGKHSQWVAPSSKGLGMRLIRSTAQKRLPTNLVPLLVDLHEMGAVFAPVAAILAGMGVDIFEQFLLDGTPQKSLFHASSSPGRFPGPFLMRHWRRTRR